MQCDNMERLPFDMNYLTATMEERAEKELGETPEVRREALMQMRILIEEDSKFNIPVDDEYLLLYLRNRKFNAKAAVNQLRSLLLQKVPSQIFDKLDFDGFKNAVQKKIISVMPYRDYDGAVIVIIQSRYWDVNEVGFDAVLRAITNTCVSCIDWHIATQICGIKIIFDLSGLDWKHMKYISPKYIKLSAIGMTNIFPVRFRAVHFLNQSIILQYVWSILKFLVSEKMKKRIYFHSNNLESLHKVIAPAILAVELGGMLTCDNGHFLKKVEESEDRYNEMFKASYD